MNAPIIVKILISLGIILAGNKLLKNLSLAVALGTVVLALWSGHSIGMILNIAAERFFSFDNGTLLLIIFFVIWLSSQMDKTKVMRDLVNSLRAFLSPRTAMAVLPAVIGLLPMPGGAVFSAPLVDDCDEKKEVSPVLKTQINYWFRHVWEMSWPLYPGVILAMDLSGLQVYEMVMIGFPMMLTMIVSGYLFILRKAHITNSRTTPPEHHFIKLVSPIITIVAVYIIILLFFPSILKLNKYLPMVFGILAGMIVLQIQRPLGARQWVDIMLSKRALIMSIIVALVRIYGAFIEARLPGGALLMEQMRLELDSIGIPLVLLVMLISFISGLTTGISVGFVGASMPIAFSLLGTDAELATRLGIMALTYPFGFIGVMLSPVHVCFIVSNEHFNTGLLKSMGRIIAPSMAVLAVSFLVSWMLLY